MTKTTIALGAVSLRSAARLSGATRDPWLCVPASRRVCHLSGRGPRRSPHRATGIPEAGRTEPSGIAGETVLTRNGSFARRWPRDSLRGHDDRAAFDYISKPFNLDHVITVESALAS